MTKRRASLNDRQLPTAAPSRVTDSVLLGKERARQEILEIALREIMPNRLQPRTQPSPEGLEELAESIRQHGILEPIIVREIALTEYEGAGRRYEIVAGERRWRAAALAGRSALPAIVLEGTTDDRTMLELAITENLQRENLHPLDEAMAFGRMQSELGYSYAQIAERLGKSKGYVQNRLRLLQLDEDLQRLVAERPDTLAHVYEISRVPDPTARAELIAAVRDNDLSRAATRTRVQALLEPSVPTPIAPADQENIASPIAGGEDESYFQKYNRDECHEEDRAIEDPKAIDTPALDRIGLLNDKERRTLAVVTEKIERLLIDTTQLTSEDWAILSPLALRLSDLLRQVGQAQAQNRSS
jgi:ParB family transcriptional regulator, chromosome partitioning protein